MGEMKDRGKHFAFAEVIFNQHLVANVANVAKLL